MIWAYLSNQYKEIEENTEWEKLEISSRKLEISREEEKGMREDKMVGWLH